MKIQDSRHFLTKMENRVCQGSDIKQAPPMHTISEDNRGRHCYSEERSVPASTQARVFTHEMRNISMDFVRRFAPANRLPSFAVPHALADNNPT